MRQTELLNSVRKGIEAAQLVATTRLESLEGDARKVVTGLVEKGRSSQRQLAERLQQIAESEAIRNRVRPVEDAFRKVPVSELRTRVELAIDDLARRFGDFQVNARGVLETASREQLQVLARELRRIADRLAELAAGAREEEAGSTAAVAGTNGAAPAESEGAGGADEVVVSAAATAEETAVAGEATSEPAGDQDESPAEASDTSSEGSEESARTTAD